MAILLASVLSSSCGGGGNPPPNEGPPVEGGGSVKLTWLKPTINEAGEILTNLNGFNVYFGSEADAQLIIAGDQSPFVYSVDNSGISENNSITCENLSAETEMSCSLTGLTDDTNWYFSVTAYSMINGHYLESSRSAIVCKQFKSTPCLPT